MLVLTRKEAERLSIRPGVKLAERLIAAGIDPKIFEVEIAVVSIRGEAVRLGLEADTDIEFQRDDVKKAA